MNRKRILNSVFVLVALGTTALVTRHFAHTGWPLRNANLWLVGLAGLIFLVAYAAKAWGWQRLFTREQRPSVLALAASMANVRPYVVVITITLRIRPATRTPAR